uniref:Uncharacterized protein n=1 Tax=Ditylenchus dipsaci TaxID=166011 RepID=A0A915D5A5_9BILA
MLLDGDLVITHPIGKCQRPTVDKDESTANGNPKEAVVKETRILANEHGRIQGIYGRLLKMFFDCDRSLLSLR